MGLHLMEAAADAGSTEAIAALGEALHWMGNSQAATPWLEKALRVGASRASWIHGLLGEAYASTGRPREAIESLELAAQDYSEFGVPLAKALIACGRLEEGRTLLETLVDSGEYGAAIQLGNLLSEEGDDDGAERAYRAGIETDDENSAFNLGLLYEGQGRHEEAREAFAMAEVLRDIWIPPQSDGDAEDG
jgi:tetratricopeptide (TPR) repeat protein